jgi:hypothetical protein
MWKKKFFLGTRNRNVIMYGVIPGVDVTAGPLARGQYIYGRASQTEQRSARWASWYSRANWASNFRFFRVIQYRLITD